tara:strand:+ start:150 stop:1544 length:1395 start_codon:yes stop_codon:yes gene_type:complete
MSKNNSILFFLCFFIFLFKVFSIKITNFDFFGDEAQYWLWSRNLDLGYYSKPPLLPWVIAVTTSLFGNDFFTIKMISVISYFFTSIIIYLISNKLTANKDLAFLSAGTFFLIPAVSVSSYIVSTDVFLVFFWSLSILQLLIIKDRQNKLNFILLGVFVGLAFLAKYAAIYFIICLAFFIIFKDGRKLFFKNKLYPFLFILSFLLVVAPNIVWNFNNGWQTFGHTADNAGLERTGAYFFNAFEFFVSQILMVGPLIFIFFLYFVKNIKYDFNNALLLSFSLPVFLIVLVESFLVRANANWAAVSLVGFLILFIHLIYKFNKKLLLYNNLLNFILGIVLFFLIATNSTISSFDRIRDISSFANYLENVNEKNINTIVVNDRLLFSSLSYIYKDKNIKIYTPHAPNSKISHHFQNTDGLPQSFDKSFIFIGYLGQLNYLKNSFNFKLVEKKKVIFLNEQLEIYEIFF